MKRIVSARLGIAGDLYHCATKRKEISRCNANNTKSIRNAKREDEP